MSVHKNFSRNFRVARKKAGLTQRDIVATVNIDPVILRKVETGHCSIGIETMMALAKQVRAPLWKLIAP